MRLSIKKAIPVFIVLITLVSVNQWSKFPIGNTYIIWAIDLLTIGAIIWHKKRYFHPSNKKNYFIVSLYLLWMLSGVIRGMFVAENYWEWKQLISGTMTLSLPLLVYVFSDPQLLQYTLKVWIKYAFPIFFVIVLVILPGAMQSYLGPVLLLSCFLPILNRKWRLLFLGLLILMIFVDFTARSQVLKALAALLMSFAYVMGRYLSDKMLKFAHRIFYLSPVILLYLGISGIFNPFEELASNNGKYVVEKNINGEVREENLTADSRTFIYMEVISSAIQHNYVVWGRTPARGNDSMSFGSYMAEELKTGKYERHRNEVCFPNVFTWLGLIGMVLYCFIYLKSSYLAVYKSNNIFMKLVGVFIAFRFLYGWIEDFNRFDIMNISLWMMIAMGFSEEFREMSNIEFKYWVRGIFSKHKQYKVETYSAINAKIK